MKVFSVTGLSGSGKTTTIEAIIKNLKARGYSVGTVKEIHYEAFRIDTEGKNTFRHRKAGADTVTARSHHETDIMFKGHMDIYEVLKNYTEDYVVLEGVRDAVVPEIAICKEDDEPDVSSLTFAVSGRFANGEAKTYKGLPVINSLTQTNRLIDLIEKKVPQLLPAVDPKCCSLCGGDCRELLAKYLKGEASLDDCVLNQKIIELKINGKETVIVPFVQNLLRNIVLGVVSELKGYEKGSQIEIKVK